MEKPMAANRRSHSAMKLRRVKDITNPPNDFQVFRFSGIQLQLFPDTADMHHDGVLHSVGITSPNPFVEFFRGKDPAGIGHQKQQKLILRRGEANRVASDDQLLLGGIEHRIPDLNPVIGLSFPDGALIPSGIILC